MGVLAYNTRTDGGITYSASLDLTTDALIGGYLKSQIKDLSNEIDSLIRSQITVIKEAVNKIKNGLVNEARTDAKLNKNFYMERHQ